VKRETSETAGEMAEEIPAVVPHKHEVMDGIVEMDCRGIQPKLPTKTRIRTSSDSDDSSDGKKAMIIPGKVRRRMASQEERDDRMMVTLHETMPP
jgi:hypothetical protein